VIKAVFVRHNRSALAKLNFPFDSLRPFNHFVVALTRILVAFVL